jgi:hypothetical protein
MSTSIDLNALGETLRQQYGGTQPPLSIRVSNGGKQLTVVPDQSQVRGQPLPPLKQSTRITPPGKTFELYVSMESPDEPPPQRVAPPLETTVDVKLEEGTRERTWTLLAGGGEQTVIRLRLGEALSTEEANRLLDTVKRMVMP